MERLGGLLSAPAGCGRAASKGNVQLGNVLLRVLRCGRHCITSPPNARCTPQPQAPGPPCLGRTLLGFLGLLRRAFDRRLLACGLHLLALGQQLLSHGYRAAAAQSAAAATAGGGGAAWCAPTRLPACALYSATAVNQQRVRRRAETQTSAGGRCGERAGAAAARLGTAGCSVRNARAVGVRAARMHAPARCPHPPKRTWQERSCLVLAGGPASFAAALELIECYRSDRLVPCALYRNGGQACSPPQLTARWLVKDMTASWS